jgi:hypothetical protein|tara:strand:- start:310 stop:453 length:144 start_codon:yes stop_codon:yes gene_type:complete
MTLNRRIALLEQENIKLKEKAEQGTKTGMNDDRNWMASFGATGGSRP